MTGERGPQGATGAPGEARAYAFVTSGGTVDPERSSGVTSTNVVKGIGAAATGFYCVARLPFTVKSAIVTSAYDGDAFAAAAQNSLQIASPGRTISVSSCPGLASADIQALVSTRDKNGTSVDSAFVIWLED